MKTEAEASKGRGKAHKEHTDAEDRRTRLPKKAYEK